MPNWKQLIMRLWSEAIFLIPKDMEKMLRLRGYREAA